jgi:hypothetical protein
MAHTAHPPLFSATPGPCSYRQPLGLGAWACLWKDVAGFWKHLSGRQAASRSSANTSAAHASIQLAVISSCERSPDSIRSRISARARTMACSHGSVLSSGGQSGWTAIAWHGRSCRRASWALVHRSIWSAANTSLLDRPVRCFAARSGAPCLRVYRCNTVRER